MRDEWHPFVSVYFTINLKVRLFMSVIPGCLMRPSVDSCSRFMIHTLATVK